MPKIKTKKPQINLLPVSDFEKSTIGRIIFWLLNVGRYLIIFVELVVIIALLFRFFLDKNLAELNGKIKEKQDIILSLAKVEAEFLNLQKRLEILQKLESQQLPANRVIQKLAELTPTDVYLEKLNLTSKSLTIEGVSLSEASLATLISGLQKSGFFSEIDLKGLSTEGAGKPGIKFSLMTNFKI